MVAHSSKEVVRIAVAGTGTLERHGWDAIPDWFCGPD
jgi:hypothetical protein